MKTAHVLPTMSQLLRTLRVKTLASELTDDEFDAFTSTLRLENGRELILDSLCQQQDATLTTNMIQITSSIIENRENQKQQIGQKTLDKLPKSFIGDIASNLNQEDYASLSQVSRSLYIECNDPNRLLALKWYGGAIEKHPKIQKLSIDIFNRLESYEEHVPFSESERPVCSHLTNLSLKNVLYDDEWDSILQHSFRPILLQRLCLTYSDFPTVDIMRRVFTKLDNINHLELRNVSINGDIDATVPPVLFTESFPNLDSLKLDLSDTLAVKFLQYRGANLVRLNLDDLGSRGNPSAMANLTKVKFAKLQRLRITQHTPSELTKHIIKNSPNLHSICFGMDRFGRSAMIKETISKFITGLITEKKTLTHLHVNLSDSLYLEAVGNAIQYGLESTRKWKRKKMNIGLQSNDNVDMSVTMVHIANMVHRLLRSHVDKWFLFVHIVPIYSGALDDVDYRRKRERKMNSLMKEVKELVQDLGNVELVRSEGCVFIIRSEGSQINSYKMWWKEGVEDYERVIY